MSGWQAYVDTQLVATGHIDKAAIFDKAGTSVWATSPNFKVTPEELKPIVASFEDKGDATGTRKIATTGFHIEGVKYITQSSEGDLLLGKKLSAKDGIVIERTNQALIVAHHPESGLLQSASTVVFNLAKYMRSTGY